jgi:septal ring factor EnvC (AmiA/AmiB activator)
MFVEVPQNLILMILGAFLLGWILAAINSRMGNKTRAQERDPRDVRIRSLEAELRVAQTDRDEAREKLEKFEKNLEDAMDGAEKRDSVISHQQDKLNQTTRDLKESVMKTRELRAELSDRATENVKSEVKLREVETELSVAQASTDMIATGVLDYSLAPDKEKVEEIDAQADELDMVDESDMTKAAT